MLDRIFGMIALAGLIGFMGILIDFVPDPQLVVVVVIVLLLACYDFYLLLFKNGR